MGIGVKYDDGSGSLKPLASYKGMRSPWGSDIHSMHGTKQIRSFGGGKSLIEKLRERREAADPKVAAKDLDKIDPRNGGMTVGDAHSAHPSDADATHRDANSHEPWARSFLSGIHFEKEAPTGRTIVWGYLRSDRFTGEGRAFETTGETKVPVYSFFESKDPSPAPFDIATNEDFTKSVVRCIFYWGKEEIELPNYPLDEIPEEGEKTLYLTRTVSEGEPVFALTTDEPEEGDEDTAYYKIYDFTDGEVSCDYRTTFLSLGGAGSFVGDYEGSEEINGEDGAILVTGHPGEEDAQGHDSHSGLKFLTVGARTDEESGEKIPPKIVARIIDKAEDEDWAARSLTVTPAEGSQKTVHFLGSEDIDIDLSGSGGGGAENVIGSDYIKVEDEEEEDDDGNVTTKRKVSAKIQTSDPNPSSPVEHALLTHDTDQLVRSKKTFLGSSPLANSKKVIVDGPNGKIEVQNEAGNRIIKLDAADIPNECGQGGAATIQVRKLTVTHPRAKDEKTADIYHVIGCADIDIQEGDAIQSITSGAPTQSGGFTVTPVTITLKDGTSLPAFNVSAKNGADGQDGDDGTPAGFGTPTATATELTPGSTPTATVTAIGPNTAKVFAFQFGIPKGKGAQSDWNETDATKDSFIKNKPTALRNPNALTLTKSGVPAATYDGSSAETFDVTVRNLVAGPGISLTASGNDITITNTREGGGGTTEGFTGTAPWLDGFKYNKTTHKLMYRFGSIRFENGLAVEYTPGGDDDFVDVPGGDAVEETV